MGQSNSNLLGSQDSSTAAFEAFSNNDSGPPTFGLDPDVPSTSKRQFRHPVAVFFHLAFKLSSILIYLFGSMFGQEFLGMFVGLVFMISIDFWIVKNITGRLLVGLRWWNYIDEDGNSHWVFENRSSTGTETPNSKQTPSEANDVEFILFSQENSAVPGSGPGGSSTATGRDSTIFWISLFVAPILWFFFLVSAIFSFNIHWVLFVAMALALSGCNLYGYLRCRFGTNYSYRSAIGQYIGPRMLFNLMKSNVSSQQPQQQQQQSPVPSAPAPVNLTGI